MSPAVAADTAPAAGSGSGAGRPGRGSPRPGRSRIAVAARTVGTLVLLQAALPLNLLVTAGALVDALVRPDPARIRPGRSTGSPETKTILLTGGKMTKALALARSFHRAGHRVILAESRKYRFTGHRFSRCVDRFHTVPAAADPGYAAALLDIVRTEGVDVYVPVCSPAASHHDARAKPLLEPYCEVLHADADTISRLDDKFAFARLGAALGLPVPDTRLVTAAAQVEDTVLAAGRPPYVLKSIAYDPVHRLDLTPLPLASPAETRAFAEAKPISADNPWILQTLLRGHEYCTHGTARGGRLQAYVCCPSSAFQVNYEMVDKPVIEAWVRRFVEQLELTGQFSFDFIETEDGAVLPIECNPRTHSAITLFHGQADLARAYLDDLDVTAVPTATSRPTYWLYHELWRMLTAPMTIPSRLRVIARGRDAIFDRRDPLPFLLVHHLQIPILLLRNLVAGKDWIRIDFNIGKLVEPAGD